MSKFNELEEIMSGGPILNLPHDAYTGGSALAAINPIGRSFHYHL